MVFDWTTYALPFNGGLDTKTDEAKVLPTNLLKCENGEFVEAGSLRKRAGNVAVDAEEPSGAVILGSPRAAGVFDRSAVQFTSQRVYTYDSVRSAQINRGQYGAINHKRLERFTTNEDMIGAECATSNGITVVAWMSADAAGTANAIKLAVYDDNTGAVYYHNLWDGFFSTHGRDALLAQNDEPFLLRVVALGPVILVMWIDETNDDILTVPIKTWDIANSIAATPTLTVAGAGANFDVVEMDENQVGMAYTLLAGSCRVGLVNASGTLVASRQHDSKNPSHGIAISFNQFDNRLYVTSLDEIVGPQPEFTYASYDGSDVVAKIPPTIATGTSGATPYAVSLATYREDDGTIGLTLFAEQHLAGTPDVPDNHEIGWVRFDTAGDVASLVDGGTIQHAYIASHGFFDGERGYIIVGHDSRSGLQNAYYIVNSHGVLCGRMQRFDAADRDTLRYDTGGGEFTHRHTHPRMYDGVFQCVLPFKRALDAETDDIVVRQHLTLQRWKLDTNHKPVSEEVNNALYFTGSQLHYFDGIAPVEAGFHMFPDMLDSDFVESVGAGALAAGAYNYRVYYAWLCPVTGQKMRSSAITRSVTIAASKKVDIELPSLAFTMKRDYQGVNNVWIEVFRTEVDKSTFFYKVTSDDPGATGDNGYVVNPEDDTLSVSFVDNMVDSTLITKELDYLSQGELGNFSPVSGEFIRAVGDRLFMAGGEIPENEIHYSKINHNDEPVDFSLRTVIDGCPEEGGDIKSISYMNDIPLVFKDQLIFAIVGDGLNDTGTEGGFATRTISTDVGVDSPRAMLEMPNLVMWPSGKGIYGMDESLRPQYIGAPVEDFNAQDYVAAVVVPDTNMAVFFPEEGDAVFYDYFYKRWGTWTNHAVVDAVIWQFNTLITLRDDNRLFIRDVNAVTDAGVAYRARYRIGPFRIPQQGDSNTRYFKLRKFQLLGDYESVHKLRVKLHYGREIFPFQTFEWDPNTVIDTTLWGAAGFLWGDPLLLWGGPINANDYHFEKRPKRSKAQSISFEFEDLPGDNPGKSFELTELLLEVAPYPGVSRLPATRKI